MRQRREGPEPANERCSGLLNLGFSLIHEVKEPGQNQITSAERHSKLGNDVN